MTQKNLVLTSTFLIFLGAIAFLLLATMPQLTSDQNAANNIIQPAQPDAAAANVLSLHSFGDQQGKAVLLRLTADQQATDTYHLVPALASAEVAPAHSLSKLVCEHSAALPFHSEPVAYEMETAVNTTAAPDTFWDRAVAWFADSIDHQYAIQLNLPPAIVNSNAASEYTLVSAEEAFGNCHQTDEDI